MADMTKISVLIEVSGPLGKLLVKLGLIKVTHCVMLLDSPKFVGKFSARPEVECNCDHEPGGERIIVDTWPDTRKGDGVHREGGWLVMMQNCSKCGQEMKRWLQKEAVLGDGSVLR